MLKKVKVKSLLSLLMVVIICLSAYSITVFSATGSVNYAPVVFAKLDGTEQNIVFPKLQSAYDSSVFTRSFNKDVTAGISRKNAGLSSVDFRVSSLKYDALAFYATVSDNGAWDEYKKQMTEGKMPFEIKIISSSADRYYEFTASEIAEGFKNVVPGKPSKVKLNLENLSSRVIRDACEITFTSKIQTSSDLILSISKVEAEDVFSDVLLIDDEAEGYTPFAYESETAEKSKVGNKSLKLTTYVPDGWILYASFYGANPLNTSNIRGITQNGTDGAFRFWLYVDDVKSFDDTKALQNSGTAKSLIKIGDCDSPDGRYYFWDDWVKQITDNGWNEIVLPFTNAKVEVAVPNLTKIDTLYMKLGTNSSAKTVYIDDIRISGDISSDFVEPEDDTVKDVTVAKLDGTEWPIVHPGTTGKINSADYDATHFDRYFNSAADVDINRYAYISRIAASLPVLNLQKHNIITFDMTVKALESDDSNSVWQDFKNNIQISIRDSSGNNCLISKKEVAKAFASVVPKEKCSIVLSLESVGTENLKDIDGIYVEVKRITVKDALNIKISNIVAKFDESYPTVPEKAAEEINDVVIANLNGTEWPIVHPGLSGKFHTPDYDVTHFDRYFNSIADGDVKSMAYVSRTAASLKPLNLEKYNIVSFNMTVKASDGYDDNTVWQSFKDKIELSLRDDKGNKFKFSSADVSSAFSCVKAGETNVITISLASIGKKNLKNVDGMMLSVNELQSDGNLNVKIENLIAEYDESYPEITENGTPDIEPQIKEVIFAKLDGTEWPIVHPGLSGKFRSPDDDAKTLDRYLNFEENGDIKSSVNVIRNAANLKPVSFVGCNAVAFNVFVEDNGAWDEYKNKIYVSISDSAGVTHPLLKASIDEGFSKVVPGKWSKVVIPLKGLYKNELESVNTFTTKVSGSTSKKNLHIRYNIIKAIYDDRYGDIPNAPKNTDKNLILNDEIGENAWPASGSIERSKKGNRSYKATTFVTDKGINEGWLIRMGYWGNPLGKTLNIKSITHNGTDGAIRFFVYAENAEKVRTLAAASSGSYCRIGSSDGWDNDSYTWQSWSSQIIYDGWNEIVLPFSVAGKIGNPNLEKITSFALKFGDGLNLPASTVWIDDIRVSSNTKSALPISYVPTVNGAKAFQPFEEMYGITAESPMTEFGLDLKEKTQGMSSLKFETETGSFTFVYRTGRNAVDASDYNCLEFDLYVPAADYFDFSTAALELTSSGIWDQNEMAWSFSNLNLKKGWNHIKFSFDFAGYTLNWKNERDIDLTKINFMRIYSLKADTYYGKKLTWRIDNMCFSKNGEKKIEKTVDVQNKTPYELTLSAKVNVIPNYGLLKVVLDGTDILPQKYQSLFNQNGNTVILTPTFYKDDVEYLFSDVVKVHISKENLKKYKEMYMYRLDVNGSLEQVPFVNGNDEIVYSEAMRLATYIISDVKIETEVLESINKESDSDVNLYMIFGIAGGAVLLAAGALAIIYFKKRKNISGGSNNEKN